MKPLSRRLANFGWVIVGASGVTAVLASLLPAAGWFWLNVWPMS